MSPIFGVLAEPSGQGANTTFIVSSYVKWLESGGARVVPIRYDAPQCEVDFLMHRVNGIVLPGGVTSISPTHDYGQFAHRVLKKAMGRRIPVWGTCLGHELIMRDTCYDAGEPNPVHNVPSEGVALPLTFTAEASSSDFYRSLPQDVRRSLATSNLTINLHTYGVPSETFRASKALTSAFHLVATSTDTLGKEFVALTQHVTLPIVTTQFHIEKNPYEFQEGHYDGADGSGMAPPHSPAGVRAAQQMAAWLVGQARGEDFAWSARELEDWIIWNWHQQFSHKATGTGWEQQYVFPPHRSAGCPGQADTPHIV